VYGEIVEIAIRLFLKITCVLLGYGTANTLHGNAADFAGSSIFLISTFGAFTILRPIAYRLYPGLKRSDLRRLRRGPNPKTLVALGILVILLLAFIESVWLGLALLSLIAAGTLVASAIAITNTVAER
jgi:hypothetical protein